MRPVLAMLALVAATGSVTAQDAPQFRPDPFWPKPLPGNWILGQVAGLATDRNDHVWIVHRPRTLLDDEKGAMQNPPATKCCTAAPPVMEFDAEGNLLRSWGGSGQGYEWPKSEHGIFVDKDGNVWIAGNDKSDHQVLKFAPDGKFLMQIGRPGTSEGSSSQTQLGQPAHMVVDEAANEVYVADGYLNRRIVVFDARTGAYRRHWGAYGTKTPSDDKLPTYSPGASISRSFGNPVHCVRCLRPRQ
jgi:DNA-binding beta-propeller fold protein YncE